MSSPTPPIALVKAVKMLLRPLIRLLIEYGITFPYLSNLLKSVFVEVVNEEMLVDGKRQTISRISVVSGVHRKDVKRILEEPEESDSSGKAASLGARILGIWLGDPQYKGEDGAPLPLPRVPAIDGNISFEQLVESVNKDVRPRAVLDEWLRSGLVQIDDRDYVVLDPEAFVTEKNFDERAYFLGRNLRDHLATASHNLMPGHERKFFERTVFYDRLSQQSVDELNQLSHKLAMETLQKINEEAIRLAERDEESADATYRMTFGSFYFQKDERLELGDVESVKGSTALSSKDMQKGQ